MNDKNTENATASPGLFNYTGYRFIDYATQAHLIIVTAIIFIFRGVPFWLPAGLAHIAGMVAVHALVKAHQRRPDIRPLRFFRFLYPLICYIPFYSETGILNLMIIPEYIDATFMRAEQWIFGFQPGIELMSWMPWLPLSELMYFAYFTYYFQVTGVGLYLYFTDRKKCAHFVALVSFVFYVCYLLFIILPVVGPPVFWMETPQFDPDKLSALAESYDIQMPLEFPEQVQSGPFYHIMRFIYAHFVQPGAAFPSSHVAIALVVLYCIWKYIRKIRWPMLLITTLLCVATIYCRYHYAVDVFAGILTAVAMVPLGNRLHRRFLNDR